MGKPPIFISHSAHEPEAEAALEELIEHLEANFTVLVDRERLKGGDEWEEALRGWMDRCHGAVVLVSPSALSSKWVHAEAAVLCQRRLRPQWFPLVPLLVGVAKETFGASDLRPTGLLALQAQPWDTAVVDAAFASLREAVASPTHELELVLAEELQPLRTDTLYKVGLLVGLDLQSPPYERDPARSLAIGLLAAEPVDQIEACLKLAGLVAVDLGERVYHYVAPHGWVSSAVAEQFRALSRASAPRCIGVCTDVFETCDMHVRSGSHEWSLESVRAGLGEDPVADFLRDVSSKVAKSLCYLEGDPFTLGKLNAELADDPRFVLLPDPPPSKEEIGAAVRELPNLVLLRRCPDSDEPPGVRVLRPPLERDREAWLLERHSEMPRKFRVARKKRP